MHGNHIFWLRNPWICCAFTLFLFQFSHFYHLNCCAVDQNGQPLQFQLHHENILHNTNLCFFSFQLNNPALFYDTGFWEKIFFTSFMSVDDIFQVAQGEGHLHAQLLLSQSASFLVLFFVCLFPSCFCTCQDFFVDNFSTETLKRHVTGQRRRANRCSALLRRRETQSAKRSGKKNRFSVLNNAETRCREKKE